VLKNHNWEEFKLYDNLDSAEAVFSNFEGKTETNRRNAAVDTLMCYHCLSEKCISQLCGHTICKSCLRKEISWQMNQDNDVEFINCRICGIPVDDEMVIEQIEHSSDLILYKKLVISDFATSFVRNLVIVKPHSLKTTISSIASSATSLKFTTYFRAKNSPSGRQFQQLYPRLGLS
jgi:hypothetical protein